MTDDGEPPITSAVDVCRGVARRTIEHCGRAGSRFIRAIQHGDNPHESSRAFAPS